METIPISNEYSIEMKILIPIATVYCGLFTAISNHYILKPKIENFFHKTSISSAVIKELVIDFLSSLSFITLLLSSILLTPTDDEPLMMLTIHDIYWTTLCVYILMEWKMPEENIFSLKITIKNVIFLLLCYVNTLYHYFSRTFFITLGIIYCGLYLINLIINSYE